MSHLSGEWKCHSPAPHSLLSDENARSAEFSNGAQIRLYKIYKMLTTLKKENECVSDQAFSSNLQKTSETEEHVKQHEGMQSQISDCGKL